MASFRFYETYLLHIKPFVLNKSVISPFLGGFTQQKDTVFHTNQSSKPCTVLQYPSRKVRNLRERLCDTLTVFWVCVSRIKRDTHPVMGWLRLVGSFKLQVSFAGYCLFYRALLQKRTVWKTVWHSDSFLSVCVEKRETLTQFSSNLEQSVSLCSIWGGYD